MNDMLEVLDQSLSGQRVVVVGGGIIGTMHALSALRRGASVVHLERDTLPQGATVRNFGLVWVSGRATGPELDLALTSRELWEALGKEVPGVGFRANGSLTTLLRDDERAVVEKVMERDDAQRRGFELVSADEARRINPALEGEFHSALWCRKDAAVESRVALGALRDYMAKYGRYEFLNNTELVGLGDHHVVDHKGTVHSGDQVFVCLGAYVSGFAKELFAPEPLRHVRLLMAETEPLGEVLTTSLANGDSFRYYPAFREEATQLLATQDEYEASYAIQLLCQQRLHGGLTIGDTHEPVVPAHFDTADKPMDAIYQHAKALLGGKMPKIERRWFGVYDQLSNPQPGEIYFRKEVASGVVAVTGAGGRGMTLSGAIAEESFT